jgi:predicted RNase H-like nuclease (RuvC/YqgF family)
VAAASCGRVQPQGPSLPCRDDFIGQVCVVPVQPTTQHLQDRHAAAYEESATAATGEIERLRHENAILRSNVRPSSEQDRELKEVYRRLSNAEHGWNHTHFLLDITQEEVEICTHGIIHLEHHVETQDTELEARAETIANLEQQLLEFQGQAPPEPVNPEEIDAMSGIDEDVIPRSEK